MVFLDVVYNHFGPAGNYLSRYAPAFFTEDFRTPWGEAIDFRSGRGAAFYIANALYWLEEYRFDGLRLDAVHAIVDPSETTFLVELARTVRTTVGRDVHLVLENEHNRASFLRHDPELGRRLYDAQWNDDLHHVMHVLLTGERHGYYADFADAPVERSAARAGRGLRLSGRAVRLWRRKAARRAVGRPAAAGLRRLPAEPRPDRQPGARRAAVALAPPEAVQACQAILLLSPHVPLLFMGEEWAASTPFLFFCDFQGDLAEAVRDGRRREFAAFFDRVEDVPDPLDETTFVRSRLDWQRARPAGACGLARPGRDGSCGCAEQIAPRLGDDVRVAHSHALRTARAPGELAAQRRQPADAAGQSRRCLDRQPWDPAGEPAAQYPRGPHRRSATLVGGLGPERA